MMVDQEDNQKDCLRGSSDENFSPVEMPSNGLPLPKNYANPETPTIYISTSGNGTQISGGSDEVIRHALAGERGNDITVLGVGMTGNEQYRISSYNRTKNSFTVLIYSSGANGKRWANVSIPSTVQNGKYYNNDQSKTDFRGKGLRMDTNILQS